MLSFSAAGKALSRRSAAVQDFLPAEALLAQRPRVPAATAAATGGVVRRQSTSHAAASNLSSLSRRLKCDARSRGSVSAVARARMTTRGNFSTSSKPPSSKNGSGNSKAGEGASTTTTTTTTTGASSSESSSSLKSWWQRYTAPKVIPERGTFAWYREMALICTVFGITGTSSMVVRFDCAFQSLLGNL